MTGICRPSTVRLYEVLSGQNNYIIPKYQRRYDWKYNEQVDELYQDLINNYTDDPNQEYLLGPIVIVRGTKKDEVVDGQQRLVTLSLWFCGLRDYLLKNKSKFIVNDDEDKEEFDELIQNIEKLVLRDNKPLIELNVNSDNENFALICRRKRNELTQKNKISTNYDSLLRDTSKDCEKIIREYSHPRRARRSIEKMFNSIKSNTSFVHIQIDDVKYAYEVFQSLNSKGQELKQADLIKSSFLSKSRDDKDDENWINTQWSKMSDNELIKKKIDYFLYYSMLSRKNKYRLPHSKSETDIPKKKMFKALKDLSMDEIKDYVNDRIKDVKVYEMLEDPRLAEQYDYDNDHVHMLYGIKQIKARYFHRAIIAAYREWGRTNETKCLIDHLLRFFFMYRTICKKDIDVIKKIAKEVTFKIHETKEPKKVIDIILYNNKHEPYVTQEEFKTELEKNVDELTSDTVKYILYSIERKLQMEKGIPTANQNKYELEHVFPKNPNSKLWPNHKELEPDRERLGNITLLNSGWNKKMGNRGFESKKNQDKECYVKSGIQLNEYFKSIKKWNSDEIELREGKLLDSAFKIWNLRK